MKFEYLYNPEVCSCPRGSTGQCPRGRNCPACTANHHNGEHKSNTACERRALEEGITAEEMQALYDERVKPRL